MELLRCLQHVTNTQKLSQANTSAKPHFCGMLAQNAGKSQSGSTEALRQKSATKIDSPLRCQNQFRERSSSALDIRVVVKAMFEASRAVLKLKACFWLH